MFHTNFSESRVHNETLNASIVTDTLRIMPYEWPSNPPCLTLEVYGCVFQGGEYKKFTPCLNMSIFVNSTTIYIIVVYIVHRLDHAWILYIVLPVPTLPTLPTTTQGTPNFIILQTLVPIASITIAVVVVINIIGVCLCLRYKRTADSKVRSVK